jgi:Fic family protein
MKKWNWELQDWRHFYFDIQKVQQAEQRLDFKWYSGLVFGKISHLDEEDKNLLIVDLLSTEAFKTSEIEGQILNPMSLQSSIRRHLGLSSSKKINSPQENGVSKMMVDVYQKFNEKLSFQVLFEWHKLLMEGRKDLTNVGEFRSHPEPMQIVSGALGKLKVHFQAPPSTQVKLEMKSYISWFNQSACQDSSYESTSALVRSAIAHLYFESIHPFEDGNGRIGRAIIEKALSQSFKRPTLLAISYAIEAEKKEYYQALAKASRTNEITDWILYFSELLLRAQSRTIQWIDFVLQKNKYFQSFQGQLNSRQEKALLRMFQEGPDGFLGGMSAEKYIAITKTSRATATRDLADLCHKKALISKGDLKYTRYFLKFK